MTPETNGSEVKSLLLHSCCAPCSSYVIEYLSPVYRITVFFYNPNIYPEEEYLFRKEEQKRFLSIFPTQNQISFIDCDHESEHFYERVKGYENEPERGARCSICFDLRLSKTAECAAKGGFDLFATTLTLSPHKDAKLINAIGAECARRTGAVYLESDFKKKGGYLRSCEISKEYDMYRQNYCGCEFSVRS